MCWRLIISVSTNRPIELVIQQKRRCFQSIMTSTATWKTRGQLYCARYFGCDRHLRLQYIVWSSKAGFRSCRHFVCFDWQDSVRRRCLTRECSWSVTVRDVHFSSRQCRCSTSRRLSPPVSWWHAALRCLVSFWRVTVWFCVALCQRYFTQVPWEWDAIQPQQNWSSSVRNSCKVEKNWHVRWDLAPSNFYPRASDST